MQKSKILLIVALFFSQALLYSAGLPSSYYQMDDNATQKEEFIRYMKVLVDKSNEEIRKDREFITGFFTKAVPDAFRGLNQQTGMEAAKTMINYSELKGEYIKMVQEMIDQNNLAIYDSRQN